MITLGRGAWLETTIDASISQTIFLPTTFRLQSCFAGGRGWADAAGCFVTTLESAATGAARARHAQTTNQRIPKVWIGTRRVPASRWLRALRCSWKVSERVPIPLHHSSVRAVIGAAGEVVYVGGELVFVDARSWPPVIRQHRVRAFDAARSVSGRWLVYAGDPDARYEIHWYDGIAASGPAAILPDPCPPAPVPDDDHLQPYGALPDDRQPPRPPQPRVESVHVLGEQAVLVPAHVDTTIVRPLVHRDGMWSPLELPPYQASPTSPRPCRVACARLAGSDVIGWDGRVYAHRDGRLEPLHDDRLAIVWTPWEIVPSRDGGFFAVDAMQLFELGARNRIEHLPGRSVAYLRTGPRGMLRVHTHHDCLLYDPARDTVVSIGHQIKSHDWIVGHTDEHLLVHDTTDATLRRLSLAELEPLPRQVASIAPTVPPLAIVDEYGTLSRARIAAIGTQIVMAYGKQVRHHAHDSPDKLVTLAAPVVAVAQLGTRTGALDAAGRLHVFTGVTRTATARITQTPRNLTTTVDGRWLVIGNDRCTVVDADGTGSSAIDFPGGLAAAADPDGAIVIVGDGRRLALIERSGLVDLPNTAEQLVAIVALGRRRFLCAGQSHLFVLDLGNPELEIWVEGMTSPHLAVDPARAHVAFAVGEEVLVVPTERADKPRVRARIDTFDLPLELADPVERRIHGLHYLADGRLVVALPVGAGWILDFDGIQEAGTKRMDPHPGDVPSRYTFTIDGRRLVG